MTLNCGKLILTPPCTVYGRVGGTGGGMGSGGSSPGRGGGGLEGAELGNPFLLGGGFAGSAGGVRRLTSLPD